MKNLLNKKEIPQDVDYTVVALTKESKVIVKGGTPTPPQPTFEYVDLGLESGTLWATCNVGATKPEECGLYFQWGDIEGRTADEIEAKPCSWSTAPFNNGSSSYNSAYFASVSGTVCPNGVLAKKYDAATQNMGSDWRMPTQEDFEELTANTTSQWVTNYNGSGVNGRKYTSKTDSSKYIFIPAAGYANYSSMGNIGSVGFVWSSTLDASNAPNAWGLYFGRGGQNMDVDDRCNGFSVRGVCSK